MIGLQSGHTVIRNLLPLQAAPDRSYRLACSSSIMQSQPPAMAYGILDLATAVVQLYLFTLVSDTHVHTTVL
eukprot:COSAG01_NODE_6668_length_3555_cov_30.254340_1_plen_72_part_00